MGACLRFFPFKCLETSNQPISPPSRLQANTSQLLASLLIICTRHYSREINNHNMTIPTHTDLCALSQTHITSLPPSATAHSLIHIASADTTLAVNTGHPIPSCLALPAGLGWHSIPSEHPSVHTFSQNEHPNVSHVALQFRARLRVAPGSIADTVNRLRAAQIVTVDGNPVAHKQCLKQVVCSDLDHAVAHRVQLYQNCSHQLGTIPTAPAFRTIDMEKNVCVDVDAVAYAQEEDTVDDIKNIIAEAVQRVLDTVFQVDEYGNVIIAHFQVLGMDKVVTIVKPMEEVDDEQSEHAIVRRKNLHMALCLPVDRPLFIHSKRVYIVDNDQDDYVLFTDGGCKGRLKNVHQGINSHGLGTESVCVTLVSGSYLYCHYLQDGINDSGWGCAYRSLQTLISWAVFEGYVNFSNALLPTHKQIQMILVKMGDKHCEFMGSKEWIGANEVGYVIHELTNMEYKILHLSKGKDIEEKAREIEIHFKKNGSPIMIGGGVLAWTILGVARNEITGKAKFLILDPHYEGKDDLEIIQSKGWIGWKSVDIFKQNAFYNLCMPLRPVAV